MKVYIEIVVLLNFLLDFMILYGTKRILRRKCSFYRIILSSLIGSITIFTIWIPISTIGMILFKICISFFMNIIAFGKSRLFENTFYFYLLSIIFGGFIELLNIHKSYYINMLCIILLCPFVLAIFIYQYRKYKNKCFHLYQVKIYYKNHEYLFDGFIDTGNHLRSPFSQRPVILIDQYIPHQYTYFIPYRALNYEGLLECMKPDKILIDEKEIEHCLVGLSKQALRINDCHCILPNCIKEEL